MMRRIITCSLRLLIVLLVGFGGILGLLSAISSQSAVTVRSPPVTVVIDRGFLDLFVGHGAPRRTAWSFDRRPVDADSARSGMFEVSTYPANADSDGLTTISVRLVPPAAVCIIVALLLMMGVRRMRSLVADDGGECSSEVG